MRKGRRSIGCVLSVAVGACMALAVEYPAAAADSQGSPQERQRTLIRVLQSDAPPEDKAIACKQLAITGDGEAVPALAALLADDKLASWARIALEAIPGPASDQALREAMGRLQGPRLVGAIHSVGRRRDAQAVDGLVERLQDPDVDVASAAATALGWIGGEKAAKGLERSLAGVRAGVRPAVAEGCILCAERFLAEQRPAEAVRLYDRVRQADVPTQRLLEAIRGAILARQSAGLPLLVEQLRSADKGRFGIGLRTARELPGREVTESLAAELDRQSPDRQVLLLLAVADRRDAAVLPAVLRVARIGAGRPRATAVSVLEHLGGVSCVPVLLDAAVDADVEVAHAAALTLARLPGPDVDADLLGRLPQATGKTRQVLIELASQRRMDGALPAILSSIESLDAGIRGAAVRAVGVLGEARQAADLVRLLQKSQDPAEREGIGEALLAISGRWGAACLQHLLNLMQSEDSRLRLVGLRAMAIVGGPQALAAVTSALQDKEEAVQDEAVRTLSTWPNMWPDDAGVADTLLLLARSDTRMSHHVLGLRGYLQYLRGDKKLSGHEKTARVNQVLPLIRRPEEKWMAIAVLGDIRAGSALGLVQTFMEDPAVAEEACAAIVSIAGGDGQGLSREERLKALQTVVERSKNGQTRKRAEDTLRGIPK